MRAIAILVITAGCFTKPPRPEGDVEIPPDGNSGPACLTPPISDTFDDPAPMPCGEGFSDPDPNSTIVRDNVLAMAVTPNLRNDASCSWDMSFDQGAFVEVRKHLGPGGTFTVLQISNGNLRVGVSVIDENRAVLRMFDSIDEQAPTLIELPYDDREMRWWRLRPEGGAVVGEYSRDGIAWTLLGTSTSPAPMLTQVSLNAGAYLDTIENPGRAEFDNFNVCP